MSVHINSFIDLVLKAVKYCTWLMSATWMNGGWWCCVVAVRYPLCVSPHNWQRRLQSSCSRVCTAGPQPDWHHRWPWPETLHVRHLHLKMHTITLLSNINNVLNFPVFPLLGTVYILLYPQWALSAWLLTSLLLPQSCCLPSNLMRASRYKIYKCSTIKETIHNINF